MGNVFSMYRMYSLYELARTRAREHEALFGSREERAGEAGLSLLALLTLILVFSGKLWMCDSQVFGSAGGTPPKEIKVRAGSSQRVSERGWMFALFTCVISLSQTGWRAWMFF